MAYTTASGHKISKGTLCYHIGHLLMNADEDLFDQLADEVLQTYVPSARGSAKSRRVKAIRKVLAVPELRAQLGRIVAEAEETIPDPEPTTEMDDCEDDDEVTE